MWGKGELIRTCVLARGRMKDSTEEDSVDKINAQELLKIFHVCEC